MRFCPYCNERLKYIGIDADFDTVTEEWYCDNCQEFVYSDEPGLRPINEQLEKTEYPEHDTPQAR